MESVLNVNEDLSNEPDKGELGKIDSIYELLSADDISTNLEV
jgi:hypothetical protein